MARSFQRKNSFEEGGDLSWYLRLLAHSLRDLRQGKCSFEQMILENIEKLRKRYPQGKFTTEDAMARRDKLVHFSSDSKPFIAICMANIPNQSTTTVEGNVTCPKCKQVMEVVKTHSSQV